MSDEAAESSKRDYKRKTESELDRLGNDALLDWIVLARDSGDEEGARKACGLLAFRHEDRIVGKVLAKVNPRFADEVTMEVMESVVRSAFDGKFMGQFGSWLNTIIKRRIADFHAKQQRTLQAGPLPDEHEAEEDFWGKGGREDDNLDLVAYKELAERLRCERPNLVHRLVIQLYGPVELGYFELDAASTKAEVDKMADEPITESNIHQIWRRFKKDFMDALGDAENPEGGEPS